MTTTTNKPRRSVEQWIGKRFDRPFRHVDHCLTYFDEEMPIATTICMLLFIPLFLVLVYIVIWPMTLIHKPLTRRKRKARAVVESMGAYAA